MYIDQVKNSLTDRIDVAAQNCWIGKGGAFTGEIRCVVVNLALKISIFPALCTFIGLSWIMISFNSDVAIL